MSVKKIDGRGRPKKDLGKTERVGIRMNVGEKATLSYLCEKTGESQADIIVKALKFYYKNGDFK